MTAPPKTSLCLVVQSPGSWLTSREPAKGRIALQDQWRDKARSCLVAAQAADWHELIPTAVASVQVRLAAGEDRRAPQAYQPSWHAVREAIEEVGVNVARERLMWFGLPDPHGGQLVVELRPLVVRGG